MRRMVLAAALVWGCASAGARTTAPATQAAAATQAVSVDQSTPRGAIKLYFMSAVKGDGAAMKELLLGQSEAQNHLIAAIADQKDADRALTDAIAAKFPDEQNPDPRAARLKEIPDIEATIDQADEKVNGDTATVSAGGRPFTLKRVAGKWRIPLEVLRKDMDAEKLEQAAHQIEIQVQAMREGAKDVAAGKYSARTEAIEGINGQMFSAGLEDHRGGAQTQSTPGQ